MANSQLERTRHFVVAEPANLRRGEIACRRIAKRRFGKWIWTIGNLPRDQYSAITSLLTLVCWSEQAIANRGNVPKTEAPGDYLREDLSDAFVGNFVSPEFVYLAHVVEHFRIPKQFLLELVEAYDRQWRFGQPQTYDDALVTASRLGGSMMIAATHILGPEKPGFESAAIKCGQALALAFWLTSLADDAKQGAIRLPMADLADRQVDLAALRSGTPQKSLHHFVRLFAHRIDQLLVPGSRLFDYLGYDGQRVLRTLLGICWKAMCNVRLDPDKLLAHGQVLSDRELLALRAKHFLGLESNLPFAQLSSSQPH